MPARLVIEGGVRLRGLVEASAAKNEGKSVVPLTGVATQRMSC